MKVVTFFSECVAEFRKVIWPSRETVKASVKVVFISTAVVALFLALVDVGVSQLLLKLLSLKVG